MVLKGRFYLLMGPSAGTGKTTLEREIAKLPDMALAISHTTRPMRAGEVDGVNYHFVDLETYRAMDVAGDFVEHNEVPKGSGKFYGLSREEVVAKLDHGDLITVVDRYGYFELSEQFDCCVLFTMPPLRSDALEKATGLPAVDEDELVRRMRADNRTEEVIAERLAGIRDEMKSMAYASYFINSSLPKEDMIRQAIFIVEADRRKRSLYL